MDFDIHLVKDKATIEIPSGKNLLIPKSMTIEEAQKVGTAFAASFAKTVTKAKSADVAKAVRKVTPHLSLEEKELKIVEYWGSKSRVQYATMASMLTKILGRRVSKPDYELAHKLVGKVFDLEETENYAGRGAVVYKWTPISK